MFDIFLGLFIVIIGSFFEDSQEDNDTPVIFDMYADCDEQDVE